MKHYLWIFVGVIGLIGLLALIPAQVEAVPEPVSADAELDAALAACAGTPVPPVLVSPPKNADIFRNTITFTWKSSSCATKYRFIIMTRRGTLIDRQVGITGTRTTPQVTLTPGSYYYWNVAGCNSSGCGSGPPRLFGYKVPFTPTPSGSGGGGGGTGGGSWSVTAPGSIANYQGPAVYLDTSPTVYYADCTPPHKWWSVGTVIYVAALGFGPGELVNFSITDLNTGVGYLSDSVNADSNGQIWIRLDQTGWPGGQHYHLVFNGSSQQICGHWDYNP